MQPSTASQSNIALQVVLIYRYSYRRTSENGTPEQMVNDQIHRPMICSIHACVREIIGQGRLLHEKPVED